MDRVIDDVELELLVCRPRALGELREPVQGEPVELVELLEAQGVLFRVEVIEVAEDEPEGVPYPPVRLGKSLQYLFRYPYVLAVVLARDPQAQDLGSVLPDDLLRGHDIAEGLAHLPAGA